MAALGVGSEGDSDEGGGPCGAASAEEEGGGEGELGEGGEDEGVGGAVEGAGPKEGEGEGHVAAEEILVAEDGVDALVVVGVDGEEGLVVGEGVLVEGEERDEEGTGEQGEVEGAAGVCELGEGGEHAGGGEGAEAGDAGSEDFAVGGASGEGEGEPGEGGEQEGGVGGAGATLVGGAAGEQPGGGADGGEGEDQGFFGVGVGEEAGGPREGGKAQQGGSHTEGQEGAGLWLNALYHSADYIFSGGGTHPVGLRRGQKKSLSPHRRGATLDAPYSGDYISHRHNMLCLASE